MYELVYIVPAEYDEEKAGKINKEVIKTITSRNGALVKDDLVGEKNLQYPIKGHARGKYFLIEFTIPVDHLDSLEKDLNLKDDILRHLISKKEIQVQKEGSSEEKKEEKIKEEESTSKETKKKKEYTIVKSDEEKTKEKKTQKTTLDDLDKKLDEILD